MNDYGYAKECLDRALYTLQVHPGRIQQRLADAKRDHLDNFPLSGLPSDLQPLFASTVADINEDATDDRCSHLVRPAVPGGAEDRRGRALDRFV